MLMVVSRRMVVGVRILDLDKHQNVALLHCTKSPDGDDEETWNTGLSP